MILLDNRYVENSSSAIVEEDANGNTFQNRVLKNGETHRVLKNFPDEAELQSLIADSAKNAVFKTWPFFWAFKYEVV
ncbi:MAG: hypothetical protein Q7T66_16345 [Herminiimonas sp.]|uniref:hypothetical protein n=1 Tax=Herminiimonas sp. TaxID=1926289 RepID=UPI002716A39F|nr:hypothetical protein [Herminiimonas sp.]MDO9422231.1 hypothetical protein [Herminiimonas sp.]